MTDTFLAAESALHKDAVTVPLEAIGREQGPVEVSSTQDLRVVTSETPSTGYSWTILKNDCGARLKFKEHVYGKTGDEKFDQLYGVGKVHTFVFETPGPDSNHIRGLPCDVEFASVRPWENNANVADQFKKKLTVTVN